LGQQRGERDPPFPTRPRKGRRTGGGGSPVREGERGGKKGVLASIQPPGGGDCGRVLLLEKKREKKFFHAPEGEPKQRQLPSVLKKKKGKKGKKKQVPAPSLKNIVLKKEGRCLHYSYLFEGKKKGKGEGEKERRELLYIGREK